MDLDNKNRRQLTTIAKQYGVKYLNNKGKDQIKEEIRNNMSEDEVEENPPSSEEIDPELAQDSKEAQESANDIENESNEEVQEDFSEKSENTNEYSEEYKQMEDELKDDEQYPEEKHESKKEGDKESKPEEAEGKQINRQQPYNPPQSGVIGQTVFETPSTRRKDREGSSETKYIKKENVSREAKQWEYFITTELSTTPKEFLERNPEHPQKEIISELIDN